ncbi:MAG: hypothetical protein COX96_04540 [Candidatus Omnitrophica bacterium CG_4_10_14_0_2_um_filter_44_9]|nr:MAG: hypothetical protein COY78_04075 [Candidatus Omnitrophica bacterium CG_4_10_14_0_8_um_filter_44_12]PIZ84253.1 MAG: hypothetical protein COX96_04540 [Candidatus Omnitrophica bacterium CG_4_10_14_0_2_um_filter_44_9]
MTNRIKYHEGSKLSGDFSNFLLTQQVMLYQNQEDLLALVLDFIKAKEEKAKKEGILEVVEKITSEIKKQMQTYVDLVTKIVDFIYATAKEEFKDKDLKILVSRTNFCFETKGINILFIIDASFENELTFSTMLHEVSQMVLEQDNFISELFYLNKRNIELDEDLIMNEYPFQRKIEY